MQQSLEGMQNGLNCVKCIMFCNPCFCCLYNASPQFKQAFEVPKNHGMVRGLPVGSVRLSEQEQSQFLSRWSGNWKIQPLQAGKGLEYTDAFINGDTLILSGGFHNARRHKRTAAVANTPQEQKLMLFRAPNGDLYVDNIGSKFIDEVDGQMTFDTAFETRDLYQREWKRMGLAGPGAPVAVSNISEQPPAYAASGTPIDPPPAYEALPTQPKMSHC
eukprot:2924929-Rhodomonas_salina.3